MNSFRPPIRLSRFLSPGLDMRVLVSSLVLAALCSPLSACHRAESDEVPIGRPTPLAKVQRTDRISFLSGASAALSQAEDALHRRAAADDALLRTARLLDLAHASAARGDVPVEAGWEAKAASALARIDRASRGGRHGEVEAALAEAKLDIDQAQQAASIEF